MTLPRTIAGRIVVVVDGTPTGAAIGLDRFAARGVAWAASHAAVPQAAALVSAAGMWTGDHVLLRAACDRVVARAALVAAAFAGADLFVGELGMDAAVELDRTGAEVVATDVADVQRIAALATAQRTTAARALRRIGRGPLGGRLRLDPRRRGAAGRGSARARPASAWRLRRQSEIAAVVR